MTAVPRIVAPNMIITLKDPHYKYGTGDITIKVLAVRWDLLRYFEDKETFIHAKRVYWDGSLSHEPFSLLCDIAEANKAAQAWLDEQDRQQKEQARQQKELAGQQAEEVDA